MTDTKKNYLSFDDLLAEPDVRYDEVQTKRGTVRMASCSSADILSWFAENDLKQEYSGLRLLSRCILGEGDKRLGEGLPNDEREALRSEFVRKMAQRDSVENGVLARKCLELNGLKAKTDVTVEKVLGEGSGGAAPVASPSASPSPSAT